MGGLYFALIPGIVIRDLHEKNVALGGLIVFELAAIAAALVLLGRRLRPVTAMTSGLLGLLPAVALIVVAQARAVAPAAADRYGIRRRPAGARLPRQPRGGQPDRP